MRRKNKRKQDYREIPDIEIIDLEEESISDPSMADGPTAYYIRNQKDNRLSAKRRRIWPFLLIIFLLLAAIVILLLYIHGLHSSSGHREFPSHESSGQPSQEADPTVPILDHIVAAPAQAKGSPADDGETIIVAFGNSPLADGRNTSSSLAKQLESLTGATIYNCAVADSGLCAKGNVLSSSLTPLDAFHFYWLASSVCQRNNRYVYEDIFASLGKETPSDAKDAYELLQTIDFTKVDILLLMYDAQDYLEGNLITNPQQQEDLRAFTNHMSAGIKLFQQAYPHIRIMIMSPAYAYALDPDQEFMDSREYQYNNATLTDYVNAQYMAAVNCEVTFIDNFNGTITSHNASTYLKDHLHLNDAGKTILAERFAAILQTDKKNE